MDDQVLTFVLLAIGFTLLGVELLLPTGGLVGVMCASCFLGSAYFAYSAWAESNPLYWRIYVVTFLAMIPITVGGIYYLLTQTTFGNRVLLAAPSTEEVTPYQHEQQHLRELIGQRGTAISPLKPGGLVQVNRERLHAIGDGFIIESGASIEVVAINGTRVVVRPIAAGEMQTIEATEATETSDSEEPQKPSTVQKTRQQTASEVLDPFADVEPS